MKSILIPTTFEADTLNAVKAAVNNANSNNCVITLLSVKEAEDTYSANYTMTKMAVSLTAAQQNVIDECRQLVQDVSNCSIRIHNQYDLSKPLLKNLLEHLGTDLIIIPDSYKREKQKIHSYCHELLVKFKKPLLYMNGKAPVDLNNALYIEQKVAGIDFPELQQMLAGRFNMNIVSSTKIDEQQSLQELQPSLHDAILKNNIQLVIETRKPLGSRKSSHTISEPLGLPVLSIYEEPSGVVQH